MQYQTVRAGLGVATILPDCDCETYSEAGYVWNPEHRDRSNVVVGRWEPPKGVSNMQGAGLPCVGVQNYFDHPTADVLTFSYDLKDGAGVRRWMPPAPMPADLRAHIEAGGLIESHNAGFEFEAWNRVLVPRYGWCPLPATQQRCSMAKARAFGLPGSLGDIARVLNVDAQKDKEGGALMRVFSMPTQPTRGDPRRRIMPHERPVDFERYARYCDRDVLAESAISKLIPDLSPGELEWWQLDQTINRRGVGVDVEAVESAIAIIEQARERYNAELRDITDGAVQSASELASLKTWLESYGVYMPSMDEDAIDDGLARLSRVLNDPCAHPDETARALAPHRALEIRKLIGSASVLKVFSMRNQATRESRLVGMYTYHGARTGRATGNGPQPTNFPNSGPEVRVCHACAQYFAPAVRDVCPTCLAAQPPLPPKPIVARTVEEWGPEAMERAIHVMKSRSLDLLEWHFGDALRAVSASLRGMFVAAPGHDLVGADYSAIEAVCLAMIAGEQWRIDLFRANGKIYEASGAKIVGLTYDEALEYKARTGNHHACRKVGKVAELAGGYQGWINAYKQFGADEFMSDEEIKSAILAWRAASPMIVKLWGGQFVDRDGMPCPAFFRDARPMRTGLEGTAIEAVLRPGEWHSYRDVHFLVYDDKLFLLLPSGRTLTYHRPRLARGEREGEYKLSVEGWNTNPKKGPRGWIRYEMYGGLWTENVVQAVARDILVPAMIRLEAAGYATVLHVYDEIVAEVPEGFGSVDEFLAIMGEMPPWAHDWPIRAAGGWRGKRFRK